MFHRDILMNILSEMFETKRCYREYTFDGIVNRKHDLLIFVNEDND